MEIRPRLGAPGMTRASKTEQTSSPREAERMQKGQGSGEEAPELPGGLGSELRVKSFFRFSPFIFFCCDSDRGFWRSNLLFGGQFPSPLIFSTKSLGAASWSKLWHGGWSPLFLLFFSLFLWPLGNKAAPPKESWQTLFKVKACLLIAPDEVRESCD